MLTFSKTPSRLKTFKSQRNPELKSMIPSSLMGLGSEMLK